VEKSTPQLEDFMKLTVIDRVILLAVLPRESDISTLKILRDLTGTIGFNEEEVGKLEMSSSEKGTTWNRNVADTLDRDFEIGPRAHSLIEESFKKLSEAKKLTIEHLPTFEKFVED
jgi:hypothetical protein